MPHWTEIDVKQTRFYQDVFAEGYLHGYREAIICRLLRRCGELPPALTEHLSQLSLPQLRKLSEAIWEFQGVNDLEHWLAGHEVEQEEEGTITKSDS